MAIDWIITSRDAPSDVSVIGGKAYSLLRMGRAGVSVPEWICVTTQVHEELLAAQRRAPAGEVAAMPKGMGDALSKACRDMFPQVRAFAVRSSATVEDGASASYAGQFESYLNVPDDRLLGMVGQVLASAGASRVRAYRTAHRGASDPRMAVIVQPMMDAVASGVLFTADPVTGDASRSIIAAAFGLGEGVVHDLVDTDTFVFDHTKRRTMERRIASKRRMVIPADGCGTRIAEVDPTKADTPALDDDGLERLAELGQRVQSLFGEPQDIEWSVDRCGSLVVLQSRPITSPMGQRIFDNANIVENYPGLTLPLTFSFARATYEHTFRAASRAFGVPRKTLEAATPVYANLVALIEGRMYYDVLHWYELYLMVPGFEALVPAWEKALGLPPRAVPITGRSPLATRLRILGRIAYLFLSRGGMVRSFNRRFEAVQRDFRSHDLKSLSADEVFALFEEVFEQLAAPFQITVINDFFAQQSFGALDKLLRRWSPEQAERLRNDLLSGISGMASMELLGSLEALAAHVRRRPEWRELFAGNADAREVWRRIQEGLPYAELSRRIREHLWRFGNRTVFELKLETPTVDDDPRHFLGNLITLLDKDVDRARPLADPAARRRVAEACLLERGGPGRLRAALIRRLLLYCRSAVRDRETLRLLRARAYDIVRCIFRQLGKRLSETGALVEAGDVFYLTIEEIETAARSSPPSPEWQSRVADRKDEYARFAAVEPPPRLSKGRLRSPTIAAQEAPVVVPEVPEGMTMLRGLGCSAGTARGRARIVADPHRAGIASGDIIVARSTDPGWVFLLTTASGLVVERGNVLSHIAIVGRELGLPIVAGIPDATRRIPEGCTIHIDGRSGIVVVGEVPPASERA